MNQFHESTSAGLDCPWVCLESTAGLTRVPAAWRCDLGPHFTAFSAAFLEPRSELARFYPCPRACGCAHEVIHHGPNDIVGVCRCEPWNCDDLNLTAQDIRCWELSWSKLGRALCQCLLLESKPVQLGIFNTRQIGSWSTAAVPVLLTLQPAARLFQQIIHELTARLPAPFILLAPTARYLTATILEAIARAGIGFFDLQSCVRLLPSGRLGSSQPPGELFRPFTPQPKPEEQSLLERAFALVKALDPQAPVRPPSPIAAFSGYCIQGLNVSQLARKFRCSRGTILNRLKLIRRRTGMEPERLRQVSSHLANLEEQITDPRAANIFRKKLIYDDAAEETE